MSNPVDLAKYIKSNNLSNKPTFNWWVKQTLSKWARIITKFKTKRNKGKIKFGIKVPDKVEEALELDYMNVDKLWQEAIPDAADQPPIGYTEITCHLIVDVKMDLTRKARYVAGLPHRPPFIYDL